MSYFNADIKTREVISDTRTSNIDLNTTNGFIEFKTSGHNGSNAVVLTSNSGVNETIELHNIKGTGTDAINLVSHKGGINLEASSNVVIKSNGTQSLHFGYEDIKNDGVSGGEWKIVNTDINSNIHLVTSNTNGSQNNVMSILSNCNVGIGTNEPSEKLDIVGGGMRCAYDTDTISYFGKAFIGGAISGFSDRASFGHINKQNATNVCLQQTDDGTTSLNSGSDQLYIKTKNNILLTIQDVDANHRCGFNTDLGIKTTDPQGYALFCNGTGYINSGGWSASDDRIKYDEEIISGVSALSIINQLQPQYYEKISHFPEGVSGTWIPTDAEWPLVKDNYEWINEAGLIAQDIRAIPGLSFTVSGQEVNAEGTQTPLKLNYNDIYTYHIAATKELSNQLDAEKVKTATLETDLTTEKAKTATLQTQMADLLARVTALENP